MWGEEIPPLGRQEGKARSVFSDVWVPLNIGVVIIVMICSAFSYYYRSAPHPPAVDTLLMGLFNGVGLNAFLKANKIYQLFCRALRTNRKIHKFPCVWPEYPRIPVR